MTEPTDADDDLDATGPASGLDIRWRALLRDLIFVAVWVLAVTFAFNVLRWPTWAYYVVVFGGIFFYSLVGDPWAKRTRS